MAHLSEVSDGQSVYAQYKHDWRVEPRDEKLLYLQLDPDGQEQVFNPGEHFPGRSFFTDCQNFTRP